MAVKFGMPSLGHTMESGTVLEWLKQEGARLAKGDPLLMVETDKVTTEVEAPMDGTLHKIVVPAGEERPIGALLAILLAPGESADPAEIARLSAPEGAQAAPKEVPGPSVRARRQRKPSRKTGRLRISPVARKLAARHGVDPAAVTGSGPGGRITKDDILRAAAAAASSWAAWISPAMACMAARARGVLRSSQRGSSTDSGNAPRSASRHAADVPPPSGAASTAW